jgi:hypothetical protein
MLRIINTYVQFLKYINCLQDHDFITVGEPGLRPSAKTLYNLQSKNQSSNSRGYVAWKEERRGGSVPCTYLLMAKQGIKLFPFKISLFYNLFNGTDFSFEIFRHDRNKDSKFQISKEANFTLVSLCPEFAYRD